VTQSVFYAANFRVAGMPMTGKFSHTGRMESLAEPLRCLIVDDNAGFFAAAASLLESEGLTVVGPASTSAEALLRVTELRPDVTLVDVDLGGESGFDLADQLHRGGEAVIMTSVHAEQDFQEMAAASGALGFIQKSALSSGAIRDLLGGRQNGEKASSPNEPRGT
jgi:DNA-binding NarL/FixJ family response regulator